LLRRSFSALPGKGINDVYSLQMSARVIYCPRATGWGGLR